MTKTLLKAGTQLYPNPAILASCGPVDKPNIITLAWVGTVCSSPPMLSIGVRPSRYSNGLIKASNEFVINVPTAAMVRVTDYCGQVSGRDVDKFASTNLHAEPATAVGTVTIVECPLNIECRVTQVMALGSHDLFLAEVLAVQASPAILGSKGNVDLGKADPLAFGNNQYWSLGKLLGTYGFSVKK
jgi:flavin reductase (DIM6/NTAB) family NADH-FMN oxidoreductase RutF